MRPPADWRLPPGVSREVWDYLHDADLARRYDAELDGTPLLDIDRRFVMRHLSPASCVLDLGCGTGRVAVPLAVAGHRVTAVDLSEEMLRVAGAKANAAGATLHRAKANVVELDAFRDQSFDAVLCLFSTLGMVAGADARRRVVDHAYRLLKPGGAFVLHVHNRWHNLRTRPGRHWVARDLLRSLLRRANAGDWLMDHHFGRTGWTMHLFTRGEAVGLLRAAGFAMAETMPVGLGPDARLRWPWFLGRMRAYGYLLAARRTH